jgi:hypothetical protein
MLHYAPAPPLTLTISQAGTNMLLAWPGSAVGYRLESTEKPTPVATWNPVTNIANLISNQYQLIVPTTNGGQFFRLINP